MSLTTSTVYYLSDSGAFCSTNRRTNGKDGRIMNTLEQQHRQQQLKVNHTGELRRVGDQKLYVGGLNWYRPPALLSRDHRSLITHARILISIRPASLRACAFQHAV